MHPLMLVGIGLFFAGTATMMAALFSNGGANKSQQLRVFGELWRGTHGPRWQRASRIAVAAIVVGALITFAGVGASDAARTRRCVEHCTSQEWTKGTIGPSTLKRTGHPNAAAFVACRCAGGRDGSEETRADDLER